MRVLIPQKVAPPYLRAQLTSRPQLCQQVLGNLDRKVSLISAPAGYGKTSLALDLARKSALTTCWYHLDARDGNLATFYDYLCEALSEQLPDFKAELPPPSPDESAWGLAGLVTSTLYKHVNEPLLLILDNFHEVDGYEPINRFVDALITYLPPTCHLIVLSRTSTDLNLARLIAQQDLNLITRQNLHLNLEEAASIASGLIDDIADVENLHQKVNGWVAGFTLLASQSERQSPNLRPDKLVHDYLKAEFFDGLNSVEQRFALYSAAIAPFSPRELEGDFGTDLKELTERFTAHYQMLYAVSGDSATGASALFTYSPLAQSFLASQLEHADPEAWRDLNVRTGERRWAEGRFEALGYLARAKRYDLIVEKLADLTSQLRETGDWRRLGVWLRDVPEEDLRNQGELMTILAETEVMSCPAEALRHYEQALETQDLNAQTRSLAQVGSLRATYKLQRFQDVVQQSALTLANLERAGTEQELAQAYSLTASSQLMLGDYAGAKRHFEKVTRLAEQTNDSYLKSLAARGLGAHADFTGDVRQAVTYNEQTLAYWEGRGNTFEVAAILNNLASNHYYLGEVETALQHALRALSMRDELEAIGRFALLCCTLGDIYEAARQVEEAETYYQLALQHSSSVQFAHGYALQGLATLLLSRGELAEAEANARQALNLAQENKLQLLEGLAQLRLGCAQHRRKDSTQASGHFDLALDLFTSMGAQRELGLAHLYKSQVVADEKSASEHRRRAEHLETELGYPLLHAKSQPILASREQHPRLKLHTLGKLEFQRNGTLIPVKAWNGRKPRDIVLFLSAHSRGASRDQIIDALWEGGRNLEQQFSIALSRARRALGQEKIIVRQDQLYTFSEAADVEEDANLLEATPPDAPDETIRAVLELYQGDYLPGYYANWVETRREQLRTKALHLFSVILGRSDNSASSLPELASRALAIDPCHEASHRHLIRYYFEHQGLTPARRQYAQYLEALKEMGLEPNPAVTALLDP